MEAEFKSCMPTAGRSVGFSSDSCSTKFQFQFDWPRIERESKAGQKMSGIILYFTMIIKHFSLSLSPSLPLFCLIQFECLIAERYKLRVCSCRSLFRSVGDTTIRFFCPPSNRKSLKSNSSKKKISALLKLNWEK